MAVQSVERALDLLQVVAAQPGGLVEVAKATGLAPSTAFRILQTLERRGAVVKDGAGDYRVGPLMRQLAQSEQTLARLETIARPHIADLAAQLEEAACLSVPVGPETYTVFQIDSPKPVQAQDWTGRRWPMTGGSAAVIVANWPAERAEALIQSLPDFQQTLLTEEVAKATETGVSWARGSFVDGLSSVAAAVVDTTGSAVAAVVGYGPSYRFPAPEDETRVEKLVADAANRITADLEQA